MKLHVKALFQVALLSAFLSVPAASAANIYINFQPAAAAVPGGYLVDSGNTYAARGNGYTYGWSKPQSDWCHDRNASADQRLDTVCAIRADCNWTIAVPNGQYSVTVSVGDRYATKATINVEGVNYWNGVNLVAFQFLNATNIVTVTDGLLTIDNGARFHLLPRLTT